MPTTVRFAAARAIVRSPGAVKSDRLAGLVAVGLLSAALASVQGLASCSRAETRRVAADAQDAARQTAAGLDHAAAQARPVADRAAEDAKHGVDALAIAAGKATRKAGIQLEHAGERGHQGAPPPPVRSGSD